MCVLFSTPGRFGFMQQRMKAQENRISCNNKCAHSDCIVLINAISIAIKGEILQNSKIIKLLNKHVHFRFAPSGQFSDLCTRLLIGPFDHHSWREQTTHAFQPIWSWRCTTSQISFWTHCQTSQSVAPCNVHSRGVNDASQIIGKVSKSIRQVFQ